MELVLGADRLGAELSRIRQLPAIESSDLVATMRSHAPNTRWAFARQSIYPFHAGLSVPPELAVLPRKRFWSGQTDDKAIWAAVRRYRPEQILIGPEGPDPSTRAFLEAGYTRIYQDGLSALYVAGKAGGHP